MRGREAGHPRGAGAERNQWQKICNIGTIFHNRKSTQRQEPLRKGGGGEPGVQGVGGGKFRPPFPPPKKLNRKFKMDDIFDLVTNVNQRQTNWLWRLFSVIKNPPNTL